MANRVYAFDVESGASRWKTDLGRPITPTPRGNPTPSGQQPTEIDTWGINRRWGILSTPVIDADTQTLYVVNWTSPDGTIQHASFRLSALDIRNGNRRRPSITISAGSSGSLGFDPTLQKQRSALLLTRSSPAGNHAGRRTLFVAAGLTKETAAGHHGWVLAFDADAFRLTATWSVTPTTQGGGIWQAGQGPAADDQGRVYLMTGNGGWNGTTDFSESLVKLRYSPPVTTMGMGSLQVIDWFTPFRDVDRSHDAGGPDFRDQDFGSGGPVLSQTSFVLAAGKDGVLYVLDRKNLGKKRIRPTATHVDDYKPSLKSAIFFTYFPGFALNPLDVHDLDTLPTGHTHHLHGSPALWDSSSHGTTVWVWGENAPLRAWTLRPDGTVGFLAESNETASAFAARFDAMPGGMITISSNGMTNGVVWGSVPVKGRWQDHDNDGDANKELVEGVLRAYDGSTFDAPGATGVARLHMLWQNTAPGMSHPGDPRFTFNKFCPPVVADGRVFVATYDGRILVFGL
jgi:outer membrane protein assembly factor BamB